MTGIAHALARGSVAARHQGTALVLQAGLWMRGERCEGGEQRTLGYTGGDNEPLTWTVPPSAPPFEPGIKKQIKRNAS